ASTNGCTRHWSGGRPMSSAVSTPRLNICCGMRCVGQNGGKTTSTTTTKTVKTTKNDKRPKRCAAAFFVRQIGRIRKFCQTSEKMSGLSFYENVREGA